MVSGSLNVNHSVGYFNYNLKLMGMKYACLGEFENKYLWEYCTRKAEVLI